MFLTRNIQSFAPEIGTQKSYWFGRNQIQSLLISRIGNFELFFHRSISSKSNLDHNRKLQQLNYDYSAYSLDDNTD